MTRLAEAMHYGLTGDDEKCLKAVSEGLKTSERTGIFLLNYVLLAHGIANCQNVGNLGLAQTMLERIVSSWNHLRPFDKGLYHLVQARQFLLRSELGAASAQAELALKTTWIVGLMTAYVGLICCSPDHAQYWKAPRRVESPP